MLSLLLLVVVVLLLLFQLLRLMLLQGLLLGLLLFLWLQLFLSVLLLLLPFRAPIEVAHPAALGVQDGGISSHRFAAHSKCCRHQPHARVAIFPAPFGARLLAAAPRRGHFWRVLIDGPQV